MFYTFIKKDVNKYLLLLIIILLFIYSWSNIYYQDKLNNITTEYEKKFQGVTGNLVLEKANETISLKESFQKDKELLEKRYYDINAENQELISNNEKLQSELNSVKSQLQDYKSKFDILMKRFQEVQESLIQTNDEISRLSAKNKELCNKVKASNPSEEC